MKYSECELGLSSTGPPFFGFLRGLIPSSTALFRDVAEVPAGGARHARWCRRSSTESGIETYFDPILLVPALRRQMVMPKSFPHAITQRPMAMYHSWGSQNSWLRQIIGRNCSNMHHALGARLALADQDWVDVTSHHGIITAQGEVVEGRMRHGVDVECDRQARRCMGAFARSPESKKGLSSESLESAIFFLNVKAATVIPTRIR